jgi:hypothetical protein
MRSQAPVARQLLMAGLGFGTGLAFACNSTDLVATDSGPEATPVCIENVQTQNGTACEAPEGYLCPTNFSCSDPVSVQQANCTCTSGTWQCSYAAGDAAIPPGTAPTCASVGHGMQSACPANEAPGAACTVAMAGLICTYPGEICDAGSTYPGSDASLPNIDTCQCVGSSVDASLVFSCERTPCNTPPSVAPTPSDGGHPDTGARSDAGAPGDAGASDAPTDG